ncbi:unnamed protein product [Rangifer tarandus platyrhynchus]|uniref:Uncharacterized protein n=1 Tax=Rangifer tarandus platyrhynchus TaxID=3082113 RepID=A0AC59Y7B0_RANTA
MGSSDIPKSFWGWLVKCRGYKTETWEVGLLSSLHFLPPRAQPARLITPKPGVGAKEIRARGQPVWSGVCAGRGWLGPGGWALSTWVVPALCPLGTSPVALAEVWEAADTAQAHGIAHASHQVDPAAPGAPLAAVVPLGGLAGHSTILGRQEKSHHQQGTGMRGLTLQAAPSGDTVGPPGPHPYPGLPLCWRELQAGLAEEHRGQSGCQRVPSRASLTRPPCQGHQPT